MKCIVVRRSRSPSTVHHKSRKRPEIGKLQLIIDANLHQASFGAFVPVTKFACSHSFLHPLPYYVSLTLKVLELKPKSPNINLMMLRPAAQSLVRSAARPYLVAPHAAVGRRFVSTTPVNARRSWKSTFFRWGIAIAGIYYYNTSPVFAEQPQHSTWFHRFYLQLMS